MSPCQCAVEVALKVNKRSAEPVIGDLVQTPFRPTPARLGTGTGSRQPERVRDSPRASAVPNKKKSAVEKRGETGQKRSTERV